MTKSIRDYAEIYTEKFNLSVTPVRGKVPTVIKWNTFIGDEILSERFEDDWLNATGLGLLCGKPSGLICLDIDILPSDLSLLEFKDDLEKKLPPILLGRIGNPEKMPAIFFRYNGEENRKWKYLKVELLSTGNQVLLPPSLHPDGHTYKWYDKKLSQIDVDDLPILNEKLIEYLEKKNLELKEIARKKRNKLNKISFGNGISNDNINNNDESSDRLYNAPNGSSRSTNDLPATLISESGRCKHNSHNFISSWAIAKYKSGLDKDALIQAVIKYDRKINADSDFFYFNCPSRKEWKNHRDDTLKNATIFVNQIFDNNPETHGIDKRRVNLSAVDNSLIQKDYGIITDKPVDWKTADAFYAEDIKTGFTIVDESKNPPRITRKFFMLRDFLFSKYRLSYLPKEKQFIFWNGKYFEYVIDAHVKKMAQDFFNRPKITFEADRNTFLNLMKSCNQDEITNYQLRDVGLINCRNGVYDLSTKTLHDHNPDFKLMTYIDVDFIPDAKCPTWDLLLERVFLCNEEFIAAFQEFIGYAISGCDYSKFNKILILDGEGSNGKSTLLAIIRDMVGSRNCSFIDLASVVTDRFSTFNLVNKLINFCSEEPKEAFSSTGQLKKLTGNDSIRVQDKGMPSFDYVNLSKFIITYNNMPFFPDDSAGMQRRIILIPCEQNFEANPELKIDDVIGKIKNNNEFPGILARCIRAYEAAVERGHFTFVKEGENRLQQMIINSDPVRQYVNDMLSFTGDVTDRLTPEELWEGFKKFNDNKTEMRPRGFHMRLSKILKKHNAFKDRDHLGQRCFRGVCFKRFGIEETEEWINSNSF